MKAADMKTPILTMTLLLMELLLSEALSTAGPFRRNKEVLTTVGDKTFYTVEGAESVSWDEAIYACKGVGLTTAIVSNQAESDALTAASLQLAQQNKQDLLWLGAILRKADLKWIWNANGQVLTFTDWRSGAILNDPGSSPTSGYNCGYISPSPGWGTWACGSELGRAVCQ